MQIYTLMLNSERAPNFIPRIALLQTSDVVKLDELKHALKTARDPRLMSRVSEIYDRMKLKMAGKLVNLYKKIERFA